MTLERFSVVAIENNLFSEKDQYTFLELDGKEHIEKRYMEVQERWDIIRMEIKEKLYYKIQDFFKFPLQYLFINQNSIGPIGKLSKYPVAS